MSTTGTGNFITKTEINPDAADQHDMVPTVVEDGDSPQPRAPIAPAPEVVPEKPAEAEKPKPAPNPREDIASRFRNRRSAEPIINPEGPFAAPAPAPAVDENDPDALTGYEPPVNLPVSSDQVEQQQPARAEGDQRTYNVKVRGNEFSLTREQLIQEADLDASDPDLAGMSDIQLLKIAQKSIAVNEYLAESRDLVKRSRTATRDPSSTPPVSQDELDDPLDPASPQADPFEQAIEKIQFGDPDEAKAALANAIKHALSTNDVERAQAAIFDRDKQDIANFGAANADIVADEDAQGLLRSIATREALKDLRALGVTEAEIRAEGLLDNPTKTMQALTAARSRGMKVRTPMDLLNAAAPQVRQRFNMAAPTNTPAAQPAPQSLNRTEAKRGLVQQPARAVATPVAQAGAVEPKSRSMAVSKMRQMRGQSVPTG